MRCAIWYHLRSLQAEACNFTKSNTLSWFFSHFLNCANGTKSRNASHLKKKKEIKSIVKVKMDCSSEYVEGLYHPNIYLAIQNYCKINSEK